MPRSSDVRPLSTSAALADDFGRFHNYLRVSITERCNLRCVYCMPEHGVELSEKLLTLEERKRLINIFSGLGVNKLRFTGGEPTINKQLEELITHSRRYSLQKTRKKSSIIANLLTEIV